MTKVIVLLVSCLVALSQGKALQGKLRPVFPDGKIVGGEPVDITELPHQLSLEYAGSHICGASIISNNIALCAAHCVVDFSASSLRLRAGSSKRGSGGSIHSASKVLHHSSYDPDTVDYDVSLIFVSTPFQYDDTRQPIGVTSTEPTSGSVTVSGWGTTSEGGSTLPTQLQAVTVPVVNRADCNRDYASYGGITARMFCAGQKGKDSCQGDSGGPVIKGGEQVGIVSWGAGCARDGYPGVYTNVANSALRSWISSNAGV